MYPLQLDKLLQQCPSVVNIKDTKGEQPIHKAVQQGNIGNVQVLLDHNSEVDPASDDGMTPLMLACHYGYLEIMHLLVQKGANLTAVDSEGCGMVHYAVEGGQVTAIQYLTEVCELSTHARDHRLQTPLFKACSQGNIEMLNYLLRKDRSEVAAEDAVGNTALHVAAEKEHSWTCWRLLEVGGLELLHKTNKDSLTPLDLAIQNATFKNSPAVRMLKYYTSRGSHSGPVSGPIGTWYAHLMMPFFSYLSIFMVIPFTNYRGAIASAILFGILKSIQCHQPRIQSYCRWPNPVYAGMFAAGIFYTLVCMYHEILFYIYLSHQAFTILCMFLHAALIVVYLKLLRADPDACTSSSIEEDTGHVHSIMDVAKGKLTALDYCQACEIIKPRYVHHCRLCDCCYHEMDHHCLMVNKCIGRGNQRLFVVFLLLCAVNMAIFVCLSAWYLHAEFSIFLVDARDIAAAIFNYYIFVWTMLLGNAISLGWCIGMLIAQMWMISNGRLIATMINVNTTLTYKQRFNNLIAFASGNRIQRDAYEPWPNRSSLV